MDMLNLYVTYRPLRIGWCVRPDSVDDFRKAVMLSQILWGGRFNPIIPVGDNAEAMQLVDFFRLDALYPLSDDPQVNAFATEVKHLRWPIMYKTIVDPDKSSPRPHPHVTLLDIRHALARLNNDYVKGRPSPQLSASLFSWEETDPLNNVFLATFGTYPPVEETGIDYATIMKEALRANVTRLSAVAAVPPVVLDNTCPASITSYLLESCGDWSPESSEPGLYVGNSQDFHDLVTYWNLRAADIELYFYDPAHKARLDSLKNAWLSQLSKRADKIRAAVAWAYPIPIWSKSEDVAITSDLLGQGTIRRLASKDGWNSRGAALPSVHFKSQSVLAVVMDDNPPTTTFQLPEKPFLDDPEYMNQHVVVSVRPLVDIRNESVTFSPPHIPELNEHYGRNLYNTLPAEALSAGVVIRTISDTMTLTALDVRELILKTFSVFGIQAVPSSAGRVTSRLIQQMGGLQGCRVFKIAGVRALIEKYGPSKPFTRSTAIQLIGNNDPNTGQPDYGRYEHLCLEHNPELRKWKPEHAFLYLLKNDVFMAGLQLECPRCELTFWRALDDIGSQTQCEYCGSQFKVVAQLKDRDWAYRRSGLFGRDDHQEGGVAVSVTLQQIHTALTHGMLYSTGMELSCASSNVKCETDLVVLHHEATGRIGLAIGECKTRGNITQEDVTHLTGVADALPKKRFDVFLVFAKLGAFTLDEMALCKKAESNCGVRVIMLSARELEPYGMYDLAKDDLVLRKRYASSLHDMADATADIYFNPVHNTPKSG